MAVSAISYADFRPITVVTNSLSTMEEVQAWIDADADGAAAALSQYMELVSGDVDVFAMAGTVEGEHRIHELEAASVASASVLGMVTGEPGDLEMRPTLEFARLGDGTLAALAPTLVRDLSVGRKVTVNDGTRDVLATVTAVDEAAGTVSLDRAVFSNRVYVRSLVVDDPERIANAYRFSRWLVTKDLQAQPTIQGFNPDLYRLLYRPTDTDLDDMTNSELMSDYVSHPDRVGNALDLERAVRNQAFTYIDVLNGIGMGPGAGLVFSNGRIISGVFASPLVRAVPSATELSDTLAVTPAALAAIVAREKAILLQHVEASRVSVGDGGLFVAGETLAEGRINARASIEALGCIDTLSDMRVAGDISCNRSITVGGVSEFNGGVVTRGGTEIQNGASVDTLKVADHTELRGTTHADAITAQKVGAVELRCDMAHVGLIEGKEARVQGLVADSVDARGVRAAKGELGELVVDEGVLADSIHAESATMTRATVTDLEANAAVMDTLVARVIASALFKADALATTQLSASEASTTLLRAEHVHADSLHASVVKARQAELDTLLAMSATFLQTLEAPDVRAESARLDRLEADMARVRELVADRIEAPTITATRDVVAPCVTADAVSTGSVVCNTVDANRLLTASATVGSLQATDLEAQDIRADSGAFVNVSVDRWSGSRVDVGKVLTDSIETGALTCIGHAAFDTLQAVDAMMGSTEVRDLRVTETTRAARMFAEHVTVTEVEAVTVTVAKLIAHEANADRITATDACLDTLESKFANLGRADILDLVATRIDVSDVGADRISTGAMQADSFEGKAADFESAVVASLGVCDVLADFVVTRDLQSRDASILGTTRTKDLTVSRADAHTAEIGVATIDTLGVREANVGSLRAGRLDAGSLLAENVEAKRFEASSAVIESLCAEGIVLTGGSLDTRGGETIIGSATATLLRADEVHAGSSLVDTLSAKDARADTLTVTGTVATGSLVAQDIQTLGVTVRRAEVHDLHVSGQCALYGDVYFDEPVLRLPARVECSDTLVAPKGHVRSMVTTRINIGR
jgi:hypothetical protein